MSVTLRTITRADAKAVGLTRFFVGAACKNGHVAEREHERIKSAEWNRANPEKKKLNKLRRRAREVSPVSVTEQDIANIYRMQRGRCAYCRIAVQRRYHLDHVQPLASGGQNVPSNLQITCASCNLKKARKPPEVFARQMGMLI